MTSTTLLGEPVRHVEDIVDLRAFRLSGSDIASRLDIGELAVDSNPLADSDYASHQHHLDLGLLRHLSGDALIDGVAVELTHTLEDVLQPLTAHHLGVS